MCDLARRGVSKRHCIDLRHSAVGRPVRFRERIGYSHTWFISSSQLFCRFPNRGVLDGIETVFCEPHPHLKPDSCGLFDGRRLCHHVSFVDAVRASFSLPAVFKPYRVDIPTDIAACGCQAGDLRGTEQSGHVGHGYPRNLRGGGPGRSRAGGWPADPARPRLHVRSRSRTAREPARRTGRGALEAMRPTDSHSPVAAGALAGRAACGKQVATTAGNRTGRRSSIANQRTCR